jgi:hypothetical protein
MNFCQHTKQIISYRLGLLTEREKEEFEKHVQTCDICQRELKIESVIENDPEVCVLFGCMPYAWLYMV